MGTMEEQHLGNAASSATLLHQLRDLWKSPRGTVLRIEALALLAIALSFLVAAFGSCRRWSNRWIVQKGFLAANVLSVSLGTYSIGLMQSTPVKSKMYPIWSVALFTLLPCIDPVTSYVGLDYKIPLAKMVFQICLYFGYVLLMSISSPSTDIGNKAICILCAITLMKGFHRSLALVLPCRLRDRIDSLNDGDAKYHFLTGWPIRTGRALMVDISPDFDASRHEVSMDDILSWCQKQRSSFICTKRENDNDDCWKEEKKGNTELSFQDVTTAFALSHLLQRHFVGLSKTKKLGDPIFKLVPYGTIDYMRALKLVEVELAFLYETFFTSNAFLHYYQAKAAGLWTFVSFIGTCFVGVTVAIPGTMNRGSVTPGSCAGTNIIVDTTRADLIITLIIFVSLALLQLVMLIRCWKSNWARVAIACQYARNQDKGDNRPIWWMRRPIWWMRLKRSIAIMNINWFGHYLWQDKLGQYSIVEGSIFFEKRKVEGSNKGEWKLFGINLPIGVIRVYKICASFLRMFGFQYIGQVLLELWGSSKTKGGASVRLHPEVKTSIVEFLGQIKNDSIGRDWLSLFTADGLDMTLYLPNMSPRSEQVTRCLLTWHIATCYCEAAEREQQEDSTGWTGNAVATACFKKAAGCFSKQKTGAVVGGEAEKDRRVAIALSKYFAYLMKSAPELLPGKSTDTKNLHDFVVSEEKLSQVVVSEENEIDFVVSEENKIDFVVSEPRENDWRGELDTRLPMIAEERQTPLLQSAHDLGKQLCDEIPGHWKVLARFWVQALVYIAPYGNFESHREHLSQGGEFITHLWALLYHLGTDKWKPISQEEFSQIRIEREEEKLGDNPFSSLN